MNIVKLGGSLINPEGRYDEKLIQEFIALVQQSTEKFLFVVGGGKICRRIQEASGKFLLEALPAEKINAAQDWLGIAVTQINAQYVLEKFQDKLKTEVHPEILLDPRKKIKSTARIFFTGGWKPGCSTDMDMMLFAKTFGAEKVFKLSNFDIVKKIKPAELMDLSAEEKKKKLAQAVDLPKMTWKELRKLVGKEWTPGLNTPFDPSAASLGYKLRKKITLYILSKVEFSAALHDHSFRGTIVKG
jgi:uridylate kinase